MTRHGHHSNQIHTHGHECQPVIVIKDFVSDAGRAIEDAAMLPPRTIEPHDAWIRARFPPAQVARFSEMFHNSLRGQSCHGAFISVREASNASASGA